MRGAAMFALGLITGLVISVAAVAHSQGQGDSPQGRAFQELLGRVQGLEGGAIDLQEAVEGLEGKLKYFRVEEGNVQELPGPHVIIEGANFHVRDGTGSTHPTSSFKNGRGNLIIGYNELPGRRRLADDRLGSHNLVIGPKHRYWGTGGLVAGFDNKVSGRSSSVTGGSGNEATRDFSTVTGGELNKASGLFSSVSGGRRNLAFSAYTTIGGGVSNRAHGEHSRICGGLSNLATGTHSTVAGGHENEAFGERSCVSGGAANEALGPDSSVSGGIENKATGDHSSITGGGGNLAIAPASSVTGGTGNLASGEGSTVSGGSSRFVTGIDDWAAGDLLQDF